MESAREAVRIYSMHGVNNCSSQTAANIVKHFESLGTSWGRIMNINDARGAGRKMSKVKSVVFHTGLGNTCHRCPRLLSCCEPTAQVLLYSYTLTARVAERRRADHVWRVIHLIES